MTIIREPRPMKPQMSEARTPVCRCAIDHFLPPDESEIVFCPLHRAAPQMAEALRAALGWIDSNGNRRGEARMPWACAEAMRAALRAAGGE